MYVMGPGDYTINQPPGGAKYHLVMSESGQMRPVPELAGASSAASSNPGRSLAPHHRTSV
eukprot:4146919-Heterocapsa_arctica.AAC.1